MAKKTVFIDIDGVLHGMHKHMKTMCHAHHLVDLLRGYDVDLVIHSSWRHEMDFDFIVSKFPPELQPLIVGMTPDDLERYESICFYVETHEITDYVILDDMEHQFPKGCQGLIVCDENLGISDPMAKAKLRVFLKG